MAILDVRLRKYTAPAELMVLVDHIPHPNDMCYYIQKHGNRTVYRSQPNNDLVLYGIHNPNDQQGYDGKRVKVMGIDGVWHEFKGPWSSHASLMNKYFHDLSDITEVLVIDNKKYFEQGYMSAAYSMPVDILNDWLRSNNFGWLYELVDNDYAPDEPTYQLTQLSANQLVQTIS